MIRSSIASNLGNTTKAIEVQLAAGGEHLGRACDFMDQKLWQRGIDELKGCRHSPSRRMSLIGSTISGWHTKCGLRLQDRERPTGKHGEGGRVPRQAVETNVKEKYFITAVAGTKHAIARYKELDRMQEEDKKKKRRPDQAGGEDASVRRRREPSKRRAGGNHNHWVRCECGDTQPQEDGRQSHLGFLPLVRF